MHLVFRVGALEIQAGLRVAASLRPRVNVTWQHVVVALVPDNCLGSLTGDGPHAFGEALRQFLFPSVEGLIALDELARLAPIRDAGG